MAYRNRILNLIHQNLKWSDLLFVPLLVLFAADPPVFITLTENGLWVSSFDYTSTVFPVTYVTALIVFAVTLKISIKKFGTLRSAFYGISLCFGAVGFYEMYFDIFQPNNLTFFHVGMSLFAIFGLVSFKEWKIDYKAILALIAFIAAFNFWYISGNHIPTSYTDFIPLLFNSVTKVLAFSLLLIPYYRGVTSGETAK